MLAAPAPVELVVLVVVELVAVGLDPVVVVDGWDELDPEVGSVFLPLALLDRAA